MDKSIKSKIKSRGIKVVRMMNRNGKDMNDRYEFYLNDIKLRPTDLPSTAKLLMVSIGWENQQGMWDLVQDRLQELMK